MPDWKKKKRLKMQCHNNIVLGSRLTVEFHKKKEKAKKNLEETDKQKIGATDAD